MDSNRFSLQYLPILLFCFLVTSSLLLVASDREQKEPFRPSLRPQRLLRPLTALEKAKLNYNSAERNVERQERRKRSHSRRPLTFNCMNPNSISDRDMLGAGLMSPQHTLKREEEFEILLQHALSLRADRSK